MHLDERYVGRSMHYYANEYMTWFVTRLDDNLHEYQTI